MTDKKMGAMTYGGKHQRKIVPGAGLEPARSCDRGILSPLCLPISPPGQ